MSQNCVNKSVVFARVIHVLLCLLALLVIPVAINSYLSTPSYGSSDGAGMRALGLLLGLAVSLAFTLVGLAMLHVVAAEDKWSIKIEPEALKVVLIVALGVALPFFVIPFAVCSFVLLRYKRMMVPTLLWMLVALAIASFIAEDRVFSYSLFATMPIYGIISWWFDRWVAKHKSEGLV